MKKKTPITEAFLKENGFCQDDSAPIGVNRYHKKENGYTSFYATVTFRGGKAVDVRVFKTLYTLDGAVSLRDKRYFGTDLTPGTVEELREAQRELNIGVVSAAQ